jgi:hypothetical protein
MKHFKQKVCIMGGLLISSITLSQTILEEERSLQPGETIERFSWQKDFKENPSDVDVNANKTYGQPFGGYQLLFNASGATAVNKESKFIYGGAGCIYSPVGSTSFDAYDIPLQIPDGHEILGMRYAWDDTSASSSTAIIYSIDNNGAFATEHTVVSTGDTGYGSFYETLTGGLIINNATYKYGIRFLTNERGTAQEMCALRIELDSTP